MIWPLFRYILMAAFRDKLFFAILGLLAIVISLSTFFGSSIVVEQDQFARGFAAYGFRLFGVITIVMFVASYLRRSFEARDIDYLLSRPISRVKFVLTHAAAFSCIAIMAAILLGATTILFEKSTLHSGVWLWWISIAVEFVIMANVAMFFAFVMVSLTACLASIFAFYLLSRLIGNILGILQKDQVSELMQILAKLMEMVSIFIPRLDMMGQTKWILYGIQDGISFPFVLGQCAVFLAMVIGAAILDMHKRQF